MGMKVGAGIGHAKKKLCRTLSASCMDVRKGHFAVYVGESRRRFVVPISHLNHPLFQELLHWAEEEFGYDHPTAGSLTIPCTQDYFLTLTTLLASSSSSSS